MRTKMLATIMASVALMGSGVAVAQASTSSAAAVCSLIATNPTSSAGTIKGTIGRTGCTNSATWQGSLKKDIANWPDSVLATASGTNNTSATMSGQCLGYAYYYTEVFSSTGSSKQSGRAHVC